MNTKTAFFLFIYMTGFSKFSFAQDTLPHKKLTDIIKFNGYLKELNTATYTSSGKVSSFGYIHNRLNFKFYPSNNITGALELRNRIFYGQQVQDTPDFGSFVNADSGYFNFSKLILNQKSVVAQTIVDRIWIDWVHKKFEIRAGRQRINWGKTLVWNPNDLFNTYNYADFDYEEQPGSDAVRLMYNMSGMSGFEVAAKPGKNKNETVAAALWYFNKHTYDIQLLGGIYYTDVALGMGWAGNIKNAGFKGEATWFQPRDSFTDTTGILSATASIDYSFVKPIYIQGGFLFNSHHQNSSNNIFFLDQSVGGTLSAKNLMPTDWSIFGSVSGDVTPLFHAELSVIYGLDPDFIFMMPSLTYSIGNNWDLTLLERGIYFINNSSYKSFSSIFFRIKWSF